jgi:hypothetical protein
VAFSDQRLFRARALEPVAGLGDVVCLLDQQGPVKKGPFFLVAGVEPVFGLTPHGVLLLWNQAGVAAAPAGYGTQVGNTQTIPEAASANIAAGASVKISNPKILQGAKGQLFQCRFALRTLALTGIKEHDLEMQVSLPAAAGKFSLLGGGGFYNMADQFQDPADVIDSPAQNANETLPAAFPAVHARDQNNLAEMFIWEINGPTFVIYNNGSAAVTAGAIGIRCWGFRYDLAPLADDGSWVRRWVYGPMKAPNIDRPIPVIQTATYTQIGTF